jgi:hypothetical protein
MSTPITVSVGPLPLFTVVLILGNRVTLEFSEESGIQPRRVTLGEGEHFMLSGFQLHTQLGPAKAEGRATPLKDAAYALLEAAKRLGA